MPLAFDMSLGYKNACSDLAHRTSTICRYAEVGMHTVIEWPEGMDVDLPQQVVRLPRDYAVPLLAMLQEALRRGLCSGSAAPERIAANHARSHL